MTFDELIQAMNPDMYEAVKLAVELGKWPDGTKLDTEQKKICLKAMIAYENEHLDPSLHTGSMSGDQVCEGKGAAIKDVLEESPLKWH